MITEIPWDSNKNMVELAENNYIFIYIYFGCGFSGWRSLEIQTHI